MTANDNDPNRVIALFGDSVNHYLAISPFKIVTTAMTFMTFELPMATLYDV